MQAINTEAVAGLTESLVITPCQHTYTPMLSPCTILQSSLDTELNRWHIQGPPRGRLMPPRKRPLQVKKRVVQHHWRRCQKTKVPLLTKPLPPPTPSPKNKSYQLTPRKANFLPRRPEDRRRTSPRSSPPKDDRWANIDEDAACRKQAR